MKNSITIHGRRSATWLIGATLLVVAMLSWFNFGPRARREASRARELAAFRSSDANVRKRAAWQVADEPDPETETHAVMTLVDGSESDPTVREALVYALGQLGHDRNAPSLEFVLDMESEGYVCAAAWLALARCSPERVLRRAAEAPRTPQTDWDRVGMAQALLFLGEMRELESLFTLAERGGEGQRRVASRALQRSLRPLLESAGRWPVELSGPDTEALPESWMPELARRAAETDLSTRARLDAPHREQARQLRSLVSRITSGRDRIARWLYSDQ